MNHIVEHGSETFLVTEDMIVNLNCLVLARKISGEDGFEVVVTLDIRDDTNWTIVLRYRDDDAREVWDALTPTFGS